LSSQSAKKNERKLLKSSEILASIRDLTVHLHRCNGAQAESIVSDVAAYLEDVMQSEADPQGPHMQRARQTMFAVDEVRTLLAQRDFGGASSAARDAAKEWKQVPETGD
jgi:hypothetical protein